MDQVFAALAASDLDHGTPASIFPQRTRISKQIGVGLVRIVLRAFRASVFLSGVGAMSGGVAGS